MSVTTTPAYDTCDPKSGIGIAPFGCSFTCCSDAEQASGVYGIGWPMSGGALTVSLYAEDCFGNTTRSSPFWSIADYSIQMSCPSGYEGNGYLCTWKGQTNPFNVIHGTVLGVDYGFRIRLKGTITAISTNEIGASFTLERLVAGSDFVPPQSDNQWVACATGSAVCYRILAPGEDPTNLQHTLRYQSSVFPIPSGGDVCYDVKAASLQVYLTPQKFGCHTGDADYLCALKYSGTHMSCLRAVVKPISGTAFAPQFSQIGVQSGTDCGNSGKPRCGCLNGKLLTGGSYEIHPRDTNPLDVLQCGCPGEVNDKEQQIQYGTCDGYEIVVKSIKGATVSGSCWDDNETANLCVAIRVDGTSTWTTGTPIVNQIKVPWVAHVDFPTVAGAPRVILYGLAFPTGAVKDCMRPACYNEPPTSFPYLIYNTDREPVVWGTDRYSYSFIDVGAGEVRRDVPVLPSLPMMAASVPAPKPCKFLGEYAGLKNSNGPQYTCSKFGLCSLTGIQTYAGEAICSSCNQYVEAPDAGSSNTASS